MTTGDAIRSDREAAYNAALDAARALRSLQTTGVWQELPVDVQRTLCRAHGTLEILSTAMIEQAVV